MKSADFGSILFEHPDVTEVYAASYGDEDAPEQYCAFVVLAPDTDRSVESLLKYCKKRMPQAEALPQVVVLDEIPRNRAGTVDRDQLRALARDTAEKEVA